MKSNILITGLPRSGKSTLLEKLISSFSDKVGFVTKEILGESGRIGFEVETHSKKKEILAHVGFDTILRVSSYGVNLKIFDSIIPEVEAFGPDSLLYLDEIGEMQLFSWKFRNLVEQYLNSSNICLATLSKVCNSPEIDSIKSRSDAIVVEINQENREEKEKYIQALIGKILDAKRYFNNSSNFSVSGGVVNIRSDHGVRPLFLKEGRWVCNCGFFSKNKICGHSMAVEEFMAL